MRIFIIRGAVASCRRTTGVRKWQNELKEAPMPRPLILLLLCSVAATAAPKRVLYITHSAGFVHGSLPTSCAVMQDLGVRSGDFEVSCSEHLARISADWPG